MMFLNFLSLARRAVASSSSLLSIGRLVSRKMATNGAAETYKFETLKVEIPKINLYHVQMNRPDKSNAINRVSWREFRECFAALNEDVNCRVVVLSGAGNNFNSGLDFTDMSFLAQLSSTNEDIARKAKTIRKFITDCQESFNAIEKCNKPVIAAIQGACIGGGVDMISACDIRYCTQDAYFSIREIDIGMAADVGTLQRLPKIVGNESLVRELSFTGRNFYAAEALQMGLVNRVLPSKEDLLISAMETASVIATKSPVAIQSIKYHLNYSRDHSVAEGLENMANWNMSYLLSEDLMNAAMATASKAPQPPIFAKY